MLAGIRDFIHWWQIAPFVFMALLWLLGGGMLLRRSLQKRQYPGPTGLGKCATISILAAMASAAAGMVFIMLVMSIGKNARMDLRVAAFAAGGAIAVVVAYLVIYAMLELSLGTALKAATLPLLVLFVITGVVGTGTAVPSFQLRRLQIERNTCLYNLSYLPIALVDCHRRMGNPAPDLNALVELNLISAKHLSCPSKTAPKDKVGYFYYPAEMVDKDISTRKIILCDLAGNHKYGRCVLFANGHADWYEEKRFQELLDTEENKIFSEALRKAESGQPTTAPSSPSS